MKRLLPLIIFVLLATLLGFGLKNADNKSIIPSPLIDKPAPEFNLPLVGKPDQWVSKSDLLGKSYLLNVWASWCVSCRIEHPFMVEISRSGLIPVYGLNIKDEPAEASAWLKQFGNPYAINLADLDGRVSIDFGVYGAPETFLIDAQGKVRYKHVGVVDQQVLEEEIKPIIAIIAAE